MHLHMIYEAKPLTPMESKVASLLLTAKDNTAIATTLKCALRTVSASIYLKTNTTNRIEYIASHIAKTVKDLP